MAGEGYRAKFHPPGGANEVTVPLPLDGRTSSKMMRWLDQPVNLAMPRLIGCTSVIVVSKKGVWANHIWEMPTFRPEPNEDETGWYMPGFEGEGEITTTFPQKEQLAFFKSNAIDRLHSRYDPVTSEHESGLDDLRKAGEIFDDESDFQVFMFVPYTGVDKEDDPNYGKEKPDGLGPAWDRNGEPNPRGDEGTTAYNDQIRDELKGIFGKQDLHIEQIVYAPDRVDEEDAGYISHRGRALVQYQPGDGKDCESKAQWRIYFEGEQENHSRAEWDPLDSQGDDKPAQRCGGSSKNKRQSCSPEPDPAPVPEKAEYTDNCNDSTRLTPFGYGELDKAIQNFCYNAIELSTPAAPIWRTYKREDLHLHLAVQWSASGQDGCKKQDGELNNQLSIEDCKSGFITNINRCNTDTISQKYGSNPMVWNMASGCVDFWVGGHGDDWECPNNDHECSGKELPQDSNAPAWP